VPSSNLQASYEKAGNRLREWFTRRIENQSLDIARLYRVDRDRLIFRLRTIYERYLQADPTYVRAKISGATHAIDQAIDEHVRSLARELDAKAVDNLKDLMGTHPQAVRSYLKDELAGVQFQHLPYPTQNVLNELTTGVAGGGTFFDHMFHVTDGLKAKITSTIRGALVNGPERDSKGNITGDWFGDMRAKLLKDFGVDKLAEPKGPAYSSVKIYKNEARRQWNLLQRELGRRSGASLMWFAELDERSSPGCVARHGMLADELDDYPPRHFNCRCQLLPIEQGSDVSYYKQQANAWLQEYGYTRRQAQTMEAAFPWGSTLLKPAMLTEAEGIRVPRLALPLVAVGHKPPRVEGYPDSVVMRTTESNVREVYTTEGWQPLKGKGAWCETQQGFFLDSPEIGPTWTPRKRRLPLDLINRWPKMRNITWAGLGPNDVYAVRIMDQTEANAAALGIMPEQEWLSGEDIGDLVKQTLAEGVLSMLPHPHVAVAIVPVDRALRSSRPELVTPVVKVEPDDVRNIVSLTTGAAIYARDNFDGGLLAPYQRVAVVCFEPNGDVWAIRPRGLFFWALPGGHIEKDELPQDAARREMEEETGVKCTIVGHLGVLYRPWSTTQMYLARRDEPVGAPLLPEEIDAAAPVHLDNLDAAEQTWLKRRWENITAARVFVTNQEAFEEAFNPNQPRDASGKWGSDGEAKKIVMRPEGWDAASDDVATLTRSGHFYRGMTSEEYQATVGAGKGIMSRQDFSVTDEGTSWSKDLADSESYVNFGQSDPRKTGQPTYIIEIKGQEGLNKSPDGYFKAPTEIPALRITRIITMRPEHGSIVGHIQSFDSTTESTFREDAFFDATKHPRGYHGKFAPSGRKVDPAVAKAITARAPSPVSIVGFNRTPEYTGEAKSLKTKFGSKKEAGDIGEAVVAAYIQQSDPSAHLVEPIGTWKAVDGISKNEAFDVKTGLISVGTVGNRQWRFTFDTKDSELEALSGKSESFKAKYNEQKMRDAVGRKVDAARDVATVLNRTINPAVWGVILNPDTQRADLYHIPGWHTRTGWGVLDNIRPYYVGTVKYKLPAGKKRSLAEAVAVMPREKAITWADVPDWAIESMRKAGILDEATPRIVYEYAKTLDSMYWDTFTLLVSEFGDNDHGH
jgi:8-oxo-dGTP pyrophosphatase MutT (NUDIX family)